MNKSPNREVIICEKCHGRYTLKDGESLDDFKNCKCGGNLKYFEPHKTKEPKHKVMLPLIVMIILISGFAAYELSQNSLEVILFDMIPYNYTSGVWIPPTSDNRGSLGGYYNIYGQGRDFTFQIKLPGAEKAESPLDYTEEGLNGTGRLDSIEITYNTIQALLSGNFKNALFETKFSGNFNMACAAWTGSGTFKSVAGTIPGTFNIDGPITDWEGTFNITNDKRIILTMDYVHYPNGQKNKAQKSTDIIYM